jgi:hypothetical protein
MLYAFALLTACLAPPADVQPAEMRALSLMAFKNGYGFVREAGTATLTDGWLRVPEVPQASFGLLWLTGGGDGQFVDRAIADTSEASTAVDAATFDDLILANEGAQIVCVVMRGGEMKDYRGKLRRPICSSLGYEPLASAFPVPDGLREPRPVPSGIEYLVIEEASGETMLIPRQALQSLTFLEAPVRTKSVGRTEARLLARVTGADGPAAGAVPVEMSYMRKGISWMPSYGLALLPEGKARIRLDATLINDAVDLTGGTVGFIVGVPSFLLQDMLSPVSVRMAWEGLSPYFGHGVEGYAPMMTQQMSNVAVTRSGEERGWDASEPNPVDAAAQAGEKEDLYVYTVPDVTLPKGSRGLFRVFESEVPYEDVYLLTIDDDPATQSRQMAERIEDPDLVRALQRPKVWHAVRLTNTTNAPWTTGAAATTREGLPIGQALMPFTTPGDTVDVKLTVAPTIVASREENEAARELNALSVNGHQWHRVKLTGQIRLENHGGKDARVIVHRKINGRFLEAGAGGNAYTIATSAYSVNPLSEAAWDVTVVAGGSLELPFQYEVYVSY